MIVARLSFYLLLGFFPAPSWSEQVRTVIPRATLNYLSVPVAEVKGYFRDQNLENQTIIIPGSTAIAAIGTMWIIFNERKIKRSPGKLNSKFRF